MERTVRNSAAVPPALPVTTSPGSVAALLDSLVTAVNRVRTSKQHAALQYRDQEPLNCPLTSSLSPPPQPAFQGPTDTTATRCASAQCRTNSATLWPGHATAHQATMAMTASWVSYSYQKATSCISIVPSTCICWIQLAKAQKRIEIWLKRLAKRGLKPLQC